MQIEFIFEVSQGELDFWSIESVDSNDVEILVLHPDLSYKPRTTHLRQSGHIKNEATHLAQELLSRIRELVMILVEFSTIDKNHLQESRWNKRPQ